MKEGELYQFNQALAEVVAADRNGVTWVERGNQTAQYRRYNGRLVNETRAIVRTTPRWYFDKYAMQLFF